MKRKTTKHILLVEDNPDDEVLSLRAMKAAGYDGKITIVTDGEAAIEFMGKKPAVDLVILDMKLPKIHGLDVITFIREEGYWYLPIIVVSTSDEPNDIKQAYKNGVTSYVVKESDYFSKCDVIEDVIKYWTKVNRSL